MKTPEPSPQNRSVRILPDIAAQLDISSRGKLIQIFPDLKEADVEVNSHQLGLQTIRLDMSHFVPQLEP